MHDAPQLRISGEDRQQANRGDAYLSRAPWRAIPERSAPPLDLRSLCAWYSRGRTNGPPDDRLRLTVCESRMRYQGSGGTGTIFAMSAKACCVSMFAQFSMRVWLTPGLLGALTQATVPVRIFDTSRAAKRNSRFWPLRLLRFAMAVFRSRSTERPPGPAPEGGRLRTESDHWPRRSPLVYVGRLHRWSVHSGREWAGGSSRNG